MRLCLRRQMSVHMRLQACRGTIENFVAMMNEKAKELGCQNTHFANPHGLHDENHYTCCYDMALIARGSISE